MVKIKMEKLNKQNKINKLRENKFGQIFSTDIVVVIIVILFGAIFLVMNQINQKQNLSPEEIYQIAQTESSLVINNLKSTEIINSDNSINVDKLLLLSEEEIREELNLKNKFCIVFEKDGKLVKIDPNSKVYGKGSSDIIVNGEPCQ
ncbi:MAG: hypothetical protein HRU03_02285 [Nanoarchaeales archaeon]|nr:hypothetical protein [Nanoarchaeales archaeon]